MTLRGFALHDIGIAHGQDLYLGLPQELVQVSPAHPTTADQPQGNPSAGRSFSIVSEDKRWNHVWRCERPGRCVFDEMATGQFRFLFHGE